MLGRIMKFMRLAAKIAESSTSRFRVGAVLVRGGSVISVAPNDMSTKSKASSDYFGVPRCKHAEMRILRRFVPSMSLAGCKMYICRVNNDGRWMSSMPCRMCQIELYKRGVSKVYYIDTEGRICLITHKTLTN
jgi:tRNA(Arg) A34 adenosine deaminase TadA